MPKLPISNRTARQPAPKAQPKPRRTNSEAAAEEASVGNILWRLSLLLCTAMLIISLVFASINGGSQLVGGPEQKPNTTPTPPVESVDPNQTVTGSDATPIPPSPIVPPTDAPPVDSAA